MSYHHLSRKERKKIANLHRINYNIRQIARIMHRSPSTISRELRRNSIDSRYRSPEAHAAYLDRREKSRRPALYQHPELAEYVTEKLLLAWSPEQIAGRLKLDYPDDRHMQASFSSIYRWLHLGLLPRSILLSRNLRHYGKRYGEQRGHKVMGRDIRTRSKEIFRRNRLGDWEVDTIVFGLGSPKAYILNATERKSRYCCLMLLRHVRKADMMRAFTAFFGDGRLPVHTMTSDRGAEFNCHREFEQQFESLFYYTRPRSPWQKPTVENQNGLIRQFFPKGVNPQELDADEVINAMHLLNNRPRKCLNFKTPSEVISSIRCT